MKGAIVSLFSGAGGLSLGFKRGGLPPSFAADIDASACATYSENIGLESNVLDLAAADSAPLHKLVDPFTDCFAVVGGPPCQGFSTAGARRGDDPRNRLVFRYLDIVDHLNPTWFVFENVEGILTSNGGESVRDLLGCLIERGYTIRLEKINFANYGLPQSRKRVLIMGNRVGMPFDFPHGTHSFTAGKHKSLTLLPKAPSFMDAVADLPPVATQPSLSPYADGVPTDYGSRMREGNFLGGVRLHYGTVAVEDQAKYALLAGGQTMRHLPEQYWHPSFRARAFRRVADGMPTEKRGGAPAGFKRLYADQGAPTITSAAAREFIHPTENRPISLQEAARLQSFPDWFKFHGRPSMIATQIGNAVPPDGAETFARHLVALDGLAGGGAITAQVGPGLLGFRLTDANGMSPALQNTEGLLDALPAADPKGRFAYAS